MRSLPLHWVPISFSLLMIVTLAITYGMSAAFGDISVLFPYISDTGTLPPESCVFGQLLNMCAFLSAVSIYCWYSHQMDRYEISSSPQCQRVLARVSLGFGLSACLGLSIVGNFQETSLLIVHMIGALMAFGCGVLYTLLTSYSTLSHLPTPKWITGIRLFLSVISCIAFFLTFIFASLAGEGQTIAAHKWIPGEKGYTFHALSVSCEWILAIGFCSFFITMVYELRDYTLDPVKVRVRYPTLMEPEDTSPIVA